MTPPKYITASAVAKSPAFDPDAPALPRFRPGAPFDDLDVRPGRVVLVGGAPGAGKTALGLQIVVGILQNHPELRAVYGCVEMSGADLLARIVARLAGVPVGRIIDKSFTFGEKDRVKKAVGLHAQLLNRLAFLDHPFTLDHLADTADAFGATVLVPDYLQRFGAEKDLRESLDGLMSGVRKLALAGAAVVAVSSVSRQRDDRGRTGYGVLGLGSFRGSAELEFGADSAYLLDAAEGTATLRCVKNRFGKPADVPLRFDGEYQRFDLGDTLDGFDSATAGRGRR
jgi:replicative DNA helicase